MARELEKVYVVQHCYEIDDREEIKFIGVYRLRKNAEVAVKELRTQPGFSAYPKNFYITRYELDRTWWAEGFVRQ